MAEAASVRPSACPRCHAPLTSETEDALRCAADDTTYHREAGVWRFLDRAHAPPAAFTDQYRTVRRAEGWGSATADYYRRLPFEDRSGRHEEIWRIRAVTYRCFLRSVLAPLEATDDSHTALRIVDLGAGNGWLASRLTERGHQVAAVDLDDDPRDGLGATVHYGEHAPAVCLQASFDQLPWRDGVFDLAIYNGSLHYSVDYVRTLNEALRVLGPSGQVVVLDTPFYTRAESGDTMVREREQRFLNQHGIGAEASAGEAFLTDARLAELGRAIGIAWRVWRPYYGLRWALRPFQNRVLGRREPARFRVVSGMAIGSPQRTGMHA